MMSMSDDEVDHQEEGQNQAPVPVEADQQEGQKPAAVPSTFVGDVDLLNVSLVNQTGFKLPDMRHPGRMFAGRNAADDADEFIFLPEGDGIRISDRLGLLAVASKSTPLQPKFLQNTPPLPVGVFQKMGVASTYHFAELLHAASFFRMNEDMYKERCERDPEFKVDYAVAYAVCCYAVEVMDVLDHLVVRAVREQHYPKANGILVHQEFLLSVDQLEKDSDTALQCLKGHCDAIEHPDKNSAGMDDPDPFPFESSQRMESTVVLKTQAF